MALSVFDDKSRKPDPDDLEQVLGRSSVHWHSLVARMAAAYPPLDEAWNFSGAKWGWSLRLKQKKRAILYMTPCEKHFLVGFVLGEKAVEAAHERTLSRSLLTTIDKAPRYAEGRGVRIKVKSTHDLVSVVALAAVKMADYRKKGRATKKKEEEKPKRDVEKEYPPGRFVAKLRRLAECIENGDRFRIQIAGRRVSVPPDAVISIEHERGSSEEEVEFQLKWPVK
jgi:amphi-Trp domain-containing protein